LYVTAYGVVAVVLRSRCLVLSTVCKFVLLSCVVLCEYNVQASDVTCRLVAVRGIPTWVCGRIDIP